MVNIINGGFVIKAEVAHAFEEIFDGEVGVFGAVFGNELGVRGDEFAVGALGSDEFHFFKFGEGALHSVRIDFGERGEVADRRKTFAGRNFAGDNVELELFDELNVDG